MFNYYDHFYLQWNLDLINLLYNEGPGIMNDIFALVNIRKKKNSFLAVVFVTILVGFSLFSKQKRN